jgi:hypothetical protein
MSIIGKPLFPHIILYLSLPISFVVLVPIIKFAEPSLLKVRALLSLSDECIASLLGQSGYVGLVD